MARWESAPLAVEATPPPNAPAWQSAPLAVDIDFTRPVEQVRADIANLPEVDRPAALRQWAATAVASERSGRTDSPMPPGVGRFVHNLMTRGDLGAIGDRARDFVRGTLAGSFLDEAVGGASAAVHSATGGRVGQPYAEATEFERERHRISDRDNPILSTATQIGGGFATAYPLIAAAKTLPGRVAMGVPVGAGHGFVYGYGSGEGDLVSESRFDSGLESAGVGAVLGAALPVAISGVARGANVLGEAVSPTVARWRANIDQALQTPSPMVLAGRRLGLLERPQRSLSAAAADGGGGDFAAGGRSGADAAALQVAANEMRRSGRTVDDLRGVLDEMDRSRRVHSSGLGQNVLAPVDLDVGLQRLAASAIRQSPEAHGIAAAFDRVRQTGQTTVGRPLHPEAGLPHQPAYSRAMTGQDALEQFGTQFDTALKSVVPKGQGERILDHFRRALLLEDHNGNAYRTTQDMGRSLKNEANKLYPAAWRDANDFDLTPALENLRRAAAEINDPAVHGVFRRAERLFTRADGNGAPLGLAAELKRFDTAKQRLDGLIDRFAGRDSFLYSALTRLKHDLLDAVHGGNRLTPTRNAAYAKARDYYFTQKEAMDTIELGRRAMREDSDVGIDAFNALESHALRRFFRLGAHSEAERLAKTPKYGADKTQIFDTPRVQELLGAIIPRTETATGRVKMVGGKPAEFADRPERFGRFVAHEQKMVQTRNTTLGGPATARNIKDDDAFAANNALTAAFAKWRQSGTLLNLGIDALSRAVEKVFGMRNDVAVSLVRQLYTADPASRARFLADLEARMGSRAMEQFVAAVREASQAATPSSIRQATQFDQPQR